MVLWILASQRSSADIWCRKVSRKQTFINMKQNPERSPLKGEFVKFAKHPQKHLLSVKQVWTHSHILSTFIWNDMSKQFYSFVTTTHVCLLLHLFCYETRHFQHVRIKSQVEVKKSRQTLFSRWWRDFATFTSGAVRWVVREWVAHFEPAQEICSLNNILSCDTRAVFKLRDSSLLPFFRQWCGVCNEP